MSTIALYNDLFTERNKLKIYHNATNNSNKSDTFPNRRVAAIFGREWRNVTQPRKKINEPEVVMAAAARCRSLSPPAEKPRGAFYRAMHYSAKRGIAIACPSVCPYITLVKQEHIYA